MLDVALDCGVKELEFWDMTIGEVDRAIESRNRLIERESQERASFDYMLAQVLSKNISVILTGKGEAPTLQQAYPNLFDDLLEEQEQKIQQRKDDLSALRFKQFAQSYNSRFNKEVQKSDK